jgi:hypothetical protein
MPQRGFFALPDDLLPVFEAVERKMSLAYVLMGVFESNQYETISRGADLPTLNDPAAHQQSSCPEYLIFPAGTPLAVRSYNLTTGETRYAVDQLENPDSATLSHGGEFESGILICGRIATASDTIEARRIQSAISREIGNRFERVRAYWVGPGAMSRLTQGWRLTFNAGAPSEYDLVRDGVGV